MAKKKAKQRSSGPKIKRLGKGRARTRKLPSAKVKRGKKAQAMETKGHEDPLDLPGLSGADAGAFGGGAFGKNLMQRAAKTLGPDQLKARMGKTRGRRGVGAPNHIDAIALYAAAGAEMRTRAHEEEMADEALDVMEGVGGGGLPVEDVKLEAEVWSRVRVREDDRVPQMYALT